MRGLLEGELLASQKNVYALAQNHFNILSITSEEDKRKVLREFQKKDQELCQTQEKCQKLEKDMEQLKK